MALITVLVGLTLRPAYGAGALPLPGGSGAEVATQRALARARRINPHLHAVISFNPHALDEARRSDARRTAGRSLSPLDGAPVWLKDNIDMIGLPTTAGSRALVRNLPLHDAELVSRLKKAGLVILGKTNLSEWANIRSTHSISGWSATGGLARNPFALDRTACGSSSGSAVAVAAGLSRFAVGTETDGSVTCPAAMNGLVGLKPTVGLIPATGVVPISRTQDTPGPMAHSVKDAALLLDTMTGGHYARDLNANALRGARIGVARFLKGFSPKTLAVFAAALQTLQAQGAVLVDIDDFDMAGMGADELSLLLTEFKAGLNDYLAGTPPAVNARTLQALIDFNRKDARELSAFDQDLFERAAGMPGIDDPGYLATLYALHERAGPNGIDRLLRERNVKVLVAPTIGPAWSIDEVNGDPDGDGSAAKLPAVAGYPHLSVPMGDVQGLPVGLSFMGPASSEELLLSLGLGFEQAAHVKAPPLRIAAR